MGDQSIKLVHHERPSAESRKIVDLRPKMLKGRMYFQEVYENGALGDLVELDVDSDDAGAVKKAVGDYLRRKGVEGWENWEPK